MVKEIYKSFWTESFPFEKSNYTLILYNNARMNIEIDRNNSVFKQPQPQTLNRFEWYATET